MSNSINFNADQDFSIGLNLNTGNVVLTVPFINSERKNSTVTFTDTQVVNFDFVVNGTSIVTYVSNSPYFSFTAYVDNASLAVQDMYVQDVGISFLTPV